MCCKKILYVGIIVFLALFLGCSKGKNTAAKKAELNKTLTSTADTADIFKEFYSEDTAKKSPAGKLSGKTTKTAIKNQTFSPSSAASYSSADFSENGRYVVQVSCVKSQGFAEKMAGGLKDKGFPAYVSEVQNPTPNLSGTFYRIRIGGFKGFSSAKSFGENTLSPNGYQYWVDKKSNDKVGMEGYGLGAGTANSNVTSSYENAGPELAPATAPASSWSGSSTFPSPGQSSSAPVPSSSSSSAASPAASSGSAVSPEAPAAAKASPGASSATPPPSATQPLSTPSSSTQASSASPAANQPSNTPASPAAGGNSKSSTTGSGSSDWGTDSSASGSGW